MISNQHLVSKLSDPEYRKAFVESQINIGIPFQIRALMKAREMTQAELANRAGMLQPRISSLITPGKTRPNIETLRRIAEAFDCALMVRFVSFGDLVRWDNEFDPDSFNPPEFKDDPGLIERKAPANETDQRGTLSITGNVFAPTSPSTNEYIDAGGSTEVIKQPIRKNELYIHRPSPWGNHATG